MTDRLFAGVASKYDEYRHSFSPTTIQYIARRAGLSPSSVVLDLACGTGLVLREFAPRARSIYGLDLSAAMLTEARKKCAQTPARFVQGSGVRLPFCSEMFDLVTIGQAIHWFDLDSLIPELRRVLKIGGWAAILSKYPSPREPYRFLYEQLLAKHQAAIAPAGYQLTSVNGCGNILRLEQAGFSDYERQVFAWDVETPLELYVFGCTRGPAAEALGDRLPLFQADLERELRQRAKSDILRETYFDYVMTARRMG